MRGLKRFSRHVILRIKDHMIFFNHVDRCCVYGVVPMCVSMYHMCALPTETGRSVELSTIIDTHSHELPYGASN